MPTKTLTPTKAVDLGAWSDEFNALGWDVNGYGAKNDGSGYLALTNMTGRLDLSPNAGVVGFEVEFVAKYLGPPPSGVSVTALYDLGSAKVVSRMRKRNGSIDWNDYGTGNEIVLEASNDGSNWVNAYTGSPATIPPPSGVFEWYGEFDTSQITTTAYRYWRTVVADNDSAGDVRIGDFRLYVGGVLVDGGDPGVEMRYGFGPGVEGHDWGEGDPTTLFEDNSPGDNSTYVGGELALLAEEGSVNVSLTGNGVTLKGTTKTVTLTTDFETYVIGGTTDLFGASWSPEDIRADTFGILFERGSIISEIEIDAARVVLYYNSYGVTLMALREQVRQQIIIGRESGTNEVQTLTITGTPTGGTFRLTFNGVETANIAYNAAVATVQSALEAISSIGAGNVSCGGGALPGTPVTITFVGNLAASPQNAISVTNAAFTGGSSPAGSVAETTPGVRAVGAGATPNVRLRHAAIIPQPNPDFLEHRPAGEKLANHEVLLKEEAQGTIAGIPTYDELGWILSGVIARPNTATLASGVYRHVFALDNRVRDGVATFQAEYGDQFSRAHRVKGLIINGIDVALRQDGIDLGGSILAKKIEDGIAMNPGAATVQTLTFSGTGTMRLRWKGQETADLNVATMTASDVQTALRALAGIGSSTQLTVTGASSPFTITFGNAAGGPFLGFPQPLLETRTISGSPVVAVAMTTRGGYTDYPGQVIAPRHVEVFASTSLAAIASSKLTGVFSTGFTIGNKAGTVYNLDRSEESFFNYAEGSNLDLKFGLIAQANAEGMQFLPQGRSDTLFFLRILATGPLIGASAYPHRLQIDCPVRISNFGPFGESQDLVGFEYALTGGHDDSTNTNLVVTLDNGVASY